MSKVVITGNASGTGDFTIAAPNSNTDRTLTLPDHAGTVLASASVTVDEANGRFGIGTSSPATSLEINTTNKLGSSFTGTIAGEGVEVSQTNFTSGNYVSLIEGKYLASQSAPHVRIGAMYDGSGAHLFFGTSNSFASGITNTAMQIKSDGRIKIDGHVGIGASGGSYKLDVVNDSYVAYFHHSNGVGVFLVAGNNSWSAASDETLKENIVEINKDDSYNNIKNIRAITYKYIVDSDETNRLGFIAQDWQINYPQAIVKNPDDKLGLNYTDTIPILLSALQKAQEKIETLEARVTALEIK